MRMNKPADSATQKIILAKAVRFDSFMHSFADKMFTRHRHHQSAHRAGMSVVSMSMAMAIELCGHSPNARHEHEHEKLCGHWPNARHEHDHRND